MVKRFPASKITISEILRMTSMTLRDQQFFLLDGIDIPRIRVLGTLLDFTIIDQPKSKNNTVSKYIRGWLTDVSGSVIMLQIWKYGNQSNQAIHTFEDLHSGVLIDVIGKVKEYNNTKYIHVELVNHVTISDEINRRLDLLNLSTLKIEI